MGELAFIRSHASQGLISGPIPWFGYGVYDREGNRISESFRGTFVDDQGEQVPFVQYGDGYVVGEGPPICRS